MLNPEYPIQRALILDWAEEADRITTFMKETVNREFKRRGVVVATSGGIDSSTCLALSAKAFGAENVISLLMPEQHSSEETLGLSKSVADAFDVQTVHQDITKALDGLGCYQQQEDAVKRVIPEFGEGWKFKIVLPNVIDDGGFRIYSLVAENPKAR